MTTASSPPWRQRFSRGVVIPAHPLALDNRRELDETHQRALTRYYHDAGAGGVAVGVHTTQFAIHNRDIGLYEPVLRVSADAAAEFPDRAAFMMIAGVCGDTTDAVVEAETASALGYDAVLLSPNGLEGLSEDDLLHRTQAVGDILPVIGFYLQPAVGGRVLSKSYWRRLADIESVIGVKLAPFNRYRTLDAVQGIARAHRGREVSLYTGNDDSIITDLLARFHVEDEAGEITELSFVGGLLGQWAVGTKAAVDLLRDVKLARDGDGELLSSVMSRVADVVDVNGAIFDAANAFAGSIAGVNEMLRRQGLMAESWCLEERDRLSPGQREELDRVTATHPWLLDDAFVAENLARWLD